nr:MAG TPA: hypothetical protein [Bacteriophage sp.]
MNTVSYFLLHLTACIQQAVNFHQKLTSKL